MHFNKHSAAEGAHAFLSASQYHWLRYNDEKLIRSFATKVKAAQGTKLHEYAAMAIKLKRKQPRTDDTVNRYINDAIGFRMSPEVMLFYTWNAFGTADAISYNRKTKVLRIHDLKTGESKASMDQLLVYVAFFCLEYGIQPVDFSLVELRIYQNNEVIVHQPELDELVHVIDKVKSAERVVQQLREDEGV